MISVKQLCVQVGKFSLNKISFEVPTGEYAVLMGKTGSGKTTLLESVCGLKTVKSGSIKFMGIDVTLKKPAERGIGYVPQDGALFKTMTVHDHLAFALRLRKWKPKPIEQRVQELSDLLSIDYLLERHPHGLSGGERQRVALGRALAYRPGILCMDEPLSALDEDSREGMCGLLKTVQAHTGVTILHVTHSKSEAIRLADRVLFLDDEQVIVKNIDDFRREKSHSHSQEQSNQKNENRQNPDSANLKESIK